MGGSPPVVLVVVFESVAALVSVSVPSALAEPPPPVVTVLLGPLVALAVAPFDVVTVFAAVVALLVGPPLSLVAVGEVVAVFPDSLLELLSQAMESKPKVRSVEAWRMRLECIRPELHRITTETSRRASKALH